MKIHPLVTVIVFALVLGPTWVWAYNAGYEHWAAPVINGHGWLGRPPLCVPTLSLVEGFYPPYLRILLAAGFLSVPIAAGVLLGQWLQGQLVGEIKNIET